MHSVIYRFTRLVNSILPAKFHVSSLRTEAAILIQSLPETPYDSKKYLRAPYDFTKTVKNSGIIYN